MAIKNSTKSSRFKLKLDRHVPIILIVLLALGAYVYMSNQKITSLNDMIRNLTEEKDKNFVALQEIGVELETLKQVDQTKRNDELQLEIENIQKTYDKAVETYDNLVDLRTKSKNTTDLDKLFAEVLSKLSKRDYSGAESTMTTISSKVEEEEKKIAASFVIPATVPENNAPPGAGYSRQQVAVEGLGSYMVSLIAGDLSTTRVIVDTASDTDCANDCPVMPLADYVSRNGAFAGINGSYFCPSDYASCAGKTNTYDLLAMNHKKTYFNSANNVYSNNPVVIFGDGYVRFIGAASGWGRDTSPNGVLSNYPLLVSGGNVVFGGDDDPKKGSKGARSFVANKGNTVYIGVVHSATVAESARVLKTLGMENALNLDNGGSTALWSSGYKVGPGRALPNVILFVKK